MPSTTLTKLKTFRQAIYTCFSKRKDAIFDLLDALTSHGHQCQSVIELSQTQSYQRQYSSITDAIADGLPDANWPSIQKQIYSDLTDQTKQKPNCFVLDCTPNPRPFARKLADRTVVHAPNPAPGNRPICVGHQYSVLALYPTQQLAKKHWLVPISVQRVTSSQKGNEVGMTQLMQTIEQLGLKEELTISVGDSLYSSQTCRQTASKIDNHVHLFRLNSRRNVYGYVEPKKASVAGRRKEYGAKMALQRIETHPTCDDLTQTTWTTAKGKTYQVELRAWHNQLLRGTRRFRSSKHPFTLIQVSVLDQDGKAVFKHPLWLGASGKRRAEISVLDVYEYYRQRYDIEHFFRFGKGNLLMSSYQTTDADHEEDWWRLCLLAYAQLNLSSSLVSRTPKHWEKYLPEYQIDNQSSEHIATPSQTQRGFLNLLDELGSPAAACHQRGKSPGRLTGETIGKRAYQDVIFKSKKIIPAPTTQEVSNLLMQEKDVDLSDPQKIAKLIEYVQAQLQQIAFSPPEFANMLLKSAKK